MPIRRLPAEWEPQSFVQLTFPHADTDWADTLEPALACFTEIAVAVSRFEEVLIVCRNVEETAARFSPEQAARIRFAELPSNDTWARDHGGITIEEDGSPVILDFVFNGWGLKFPAFWDNQITQGLKDGGFFGAAPLRKGGLALEGGGLESDGQGTLLTTSECLLSPNRNPHLDRSQTEQYLKELFGLQRVLWLDHGYLAGDDTDSHIDTLARFCNADTIAYVQCNDPADEHYEALRAMETQLRSFVHPEGRPYRLVALPMPDACFAEDGHRLPATYANFLIINGAVLAPVYGLPQDAEALAVLADCFPEREIVPVDCRVLIEQHGSLHCVTMQYPSGLVSANAALGGR
ncbi:MAG TPA: agmatine deiminase family protein [Saprospiraceae bacterium]|nr:agmatine deiminase family protein [Saprospiraceae bacterium]